MHTRRSSSTAPATDVAVRYTRDVPRPHPPRYVCAPRVCVRVCVIRLPFSRARRIWSSNACVCTRVYVFTTTGGLALIVEAETETRIIGQSSKAGGSRGAAVFVHLGGARHRREAHFPFFPKRKQPRGSKRPRSRLPLLRARDREDFRRAKLEAPRN